MLIILLYIAVKILLSTMWMGQIDTIFNLPKGICCLKNTFRMHFYCLHDFTEFCKLYYISHRMIYWTKRNTKWNNVAIRYPYKQLALSILNEQMNFTLIKGLKTNNFFLDINDLHTKIYNNSSALSGTYKNHCNNYSVLNLLFLSIIFNTCSADYFYLH